MGDQSGSPTSEPNREHRDSLVKKLAEMLAENDACGPGPVSRQEYLDDAAALLRLLLDAKPDEKLVPESLLTVERERRQRAERELDEWKRRALDYHRALSKGYGVEDGGVWEDRALAAEARAQRLAEALERIASGEPITCADGTTYVRPAEEFARDVLASVPDREAE